jgi:rfaE bifunctional protein kinase chain/domain
MIPTGAEPAERSLLPSRLAGFQGKRVLVVGDIMLDTYLAGEVERISPEAPVPVVRIEHETHRLGGAGNVARNVAALGGSATLAGVVGKDAAAGRLSGMIEEQGIAPALLRLDRPTTVKTRVMARGQQMLRLDQEQAVPLAEHEYVRLLRILADEAPRHQVLIISDYAKGLISPAFAEMFTDMRSRLSYPPPLLVDPKPENAPLLGNSTLLTPNLKETGEIMHMPVHSRSDIIAAGQAILRNLRCRHLLSTLGPEGMALFLSENEIWHIPSMAHAVFDVTGAGDTVIATVGLALAAGASLLEACILANHAAGIVVGKVGAATAGADEVASALAATAIRPDRWL